MKKILKQSLKSLLSNCGYNIERIKIASNTVTNECPPDFSTETIRIWEQVKPYTMTSPERVASLIEAVEYIIKNNIKGSFVECGVWKGGSSLTMILALQRLGITDRDIYLFDTFSGMTEPDEIDKSLRNESAKTLLENSDEDSSYIWAKSGIDNVREVVTSTGYPLEKLHFCKGPVEETIPENSPSSIALLRLDTDWYQSTKHELEHLYPILSDNGILIIDDYGHWQGARKAVDEYFSNHYTNIFLSRIDYTGRIAVKITD